MATEEEIKRAQERKTSQIKKFQNAKTDQMMKFSAWRTAADLVAVALEKEQIKWEQREELMKKELTRVESELRKYITGLPF